MAVGPPTIQYEGGGIRLVIYNEAYPGSLRDLGFFPFANTSLFAKQTAEQLAINHAATHLGSNITTTQFGATIPSKTSSHSAGTTLPNQITTSSVITSGSNSANVGSSSGGSGGQPGR